jgi:multiple sugar transport system substrate-binding protein
VIRKSRGERIPWRLLLATLCLALGFVVAACGGDDEGGGGGGGGGGASTEKVDVAAELKKPAQLTVWAWTPGTEEAVAMFMKEYPNIDVKVQNVGQGPPHYRKVRTTVQSGQGLPDVIQMEYQFIPSFTITEDLLDLTPYLPSDFLEEYPEWVQKQINVENAIYGVPWDTGPLGFIYRKDLLDKAGITEIPTTWEEFAEAARTYHEANPDSYLVNMPGTQTGQWLGLFWQNGARPFSGNAENLTINLTDPKIKQVTDFWDPLIQDGVISTDADFNDNWYQGLANGKYAGWLSAAWGPIFLQGTAKKTSGKWRAAKLPQWNEGDDVSGNWGGSTLAVLKSTKFPAHAAELSRWLLNEREPVNFFALEQFLFPPTNWTLEEPQWVNQKNEFYGGQQVNKLYAEISDTVSTDWQWSPIHEYVATQGGDIQGKAVERGETMTSTLQPWQDAVVNYAKQQGITVAGE